VERSVWLCDLLDASDLIPLLESVLQNGTVLPGTQMMPPWLEMSSDGTEGGKKALRVFGGLESPHLLFAQSLGLMRMFCTIVQPFVLLMFHPWRYLAFGSSITSEFISNDHTRNVLQLFEQLAEKAFGSLFVPSALHQDVQHVAILIYSPPEIVRFPVDLQIDFIQVPFVATTRAAAA
jgi:hypothetical protein